MSNELVPGLLAAGAGSAAFGAIALHEHRRESAMRGSRQTYSVVFPMRLQPEAAQSALASLVGIGPSLELVCEVVADDSGIHHLLHIPETACGSVIDHLTAAIPGIRLDTVSPRSTGDLTNGARITVPTRALLRTDDPVRASRALLSGFAALRGNERVSLRWALRPADTTADRTSTTGKQSLQANAELRAVRARYGTPGFTVAGLVLVRAESRARARALEDHIANVLRGRRGVGVSLVIRPVRVRTNTGMPSTTRRRGILSATELLPLLAWPLGDEAVQGVELGAARRVPVHRDLPRDGRRLFLGHDAYGERHVALSAEAARHHLAVVGPSGVGKSVLLTRGILDDICSGFGGVVVDPKADLVADVLDRIPKKHADRTVVLDPAADGPVPGLDLLGVGDPDLRTDVVLGALESIFKNSWGIRTDTYLRLGLRTLSELPDPVLTDWLRLFADGAFRRQAVARLTDPLLITAWQSYEALGPAEQAQHVAAPAGKIVNLLARPAVRGVLAQRRPRLDIARLLAERKWLLVSLSPGAIGEPATRLLGAVLTYAVWTAIESRTSLRPEDRHPVFLYMDELQSLATLPFSIEYFLERTRGLGSGVTVATQTLSRLPDSVRTSLLGNVASLVTFRLGYDEAVRMGRELPGLGTEDIQALRRFEVAGRIGTGTGSGTVVVTGRTEPLPRRTGQAQAIRQNSADIYGQEPAVIENELRDQQQRLELNPGDGDLGRTRRSS